MRNELYKIFKSKLLYILLAVIFLGLFVFSMIFNSLSTNEREFGYGVERYSDFTVLEERIKENEEQIQVLKTNFSEGKITEKEYFEQVKAVTVLKNIYKYLLANKIRYEEAQVISYMGSYSGNRAAFVKQITLLTEMFLIIAVAVITMYCFNYDFQSGTVKFTYTSGSSRWKIMRNKIITMILCYVLFCLVYILGVELFSLPYSMQYNVLIDVVGEQVSGITPTALIVKTLFSSILDTFCFVLVFLSISLIFRNIFVVSAIYLSVYVLFQMVFSFIPSEFLNALSVPYFNIHPNGIKDNVYAIATAVKYGIYSALLAFSLWRFSKRDLI